MQADQMALNIKNLGKCYHIYNKPSDRLKQLLFLGKKQFYREYWALQDINFEVKKGESVGIIGRNGSGKSTLLQLICKTLTPTQGQIEIQGKVAALLELGAGFNPEFTGKENVFLSGAILGLSDAEMHEKYNAIIEFADIGSHIDQPVKTYSSGMFIRLAFSVQACLNPDILIVDEALSVGDIFFQQKCIERIQKLRNQGTTILFVSHDMAIVRDLCEKALYLNSGKAIFFGRSNQAIMKYFSDLGSNSQSNKSKVPLSENTLQTNAISQFIESACWKASDINQDTNKEAEIVAVRVIDENNQPSLITKMCSKLKFQILYQSFTEKLVHINITMRNRYNHVINHSSSYLSNIATLPMKYGEYGLFEIEVECTIEAGNYTFAASAGIISHDDNKPYLTDQTPWLGPISVNWDYDNEKAPWFGMFGLPSKLRFLSFNEEIA